MLQNAAAARSSFLGGLNIAVLVDRSLSTEHIKRNIAAYLQVIETAKRQNLFKCSRVLVVARHQCALIYEQC